MAENIPLNGNFCWIATWKITDRCNLKCTYCDPAIMKRANASEDIDRFAVLERIGGYAPPILNISGGEPALVKELPELLAAAKKSWNPYIRVVHNGTSPDKLTASFPYLDRLVISIDGPGDINTATRGISGDAVLEKIAKLSDSGASVHMPIPEIVVNTVVTETNICALPIFSARIASVSPRIIHALALLMPVDSELSLLRDRESGYSRFLDTYAKMQSVHPLTVHNFDCVMRHGDWRKIQCYNQYFTLRFSPRGELSACGAALSTQLRRANGVAKLFRKGGMRKAFTLLSRAVKNRVGVVDFTCRTMCSCENWLDMLLLGKETSYAPLILQGLRGRLTDADYKKLDEFVRARINKDFDINWFRRMVETSPTPR